MMDYYGYGNQRPGSGYPDGYGGYQGYQGYQYQNSRNSRRRYNRRDPGGLMNALARAGFTRTDSLRASRMGMGPWEYLQQRDNRRRNNQGPTTSYQDYYGQQQPSYEELMQGYGIENGSRNGYGTYNDMKNRYRYVYRRPPGARRRPAFNANLRMK